MAAGSLHSSGCVYEAEDPRAPVAELPYWIAQLLTPTVEEALRIEAPSDATPNRERRFTLEQASAYIGAALEKLRTAGEGRRNIELNNAAVVLGHFVPAFGPEQDAIETLSAIAEEIGLDHSEIGPTIRSGLSKGMSDPYTKTDKPDPPGAASATSDEGAASSWSPIDLASSWDEDVEPEMPALLWREDGVSLIYRGRTHSIYGESESGKSWVALVLAAQVLSDTGEVLYIDHESDPQPIKARLRALGVTREQADYLTYVRPDGPRDDAWKELLNQSYVLAIIDGVTVAISAEGASSDSTDEAARWMEEVPRALATKTGAAVLTVDHVTKARDNRGRFAIGSQAKLNAISGAAYTARVHQPFGRGQIGELVLRITKDRPGGVRPNCGPAGEHGTQEAARIILDSTDPGRIKVTISKWSEAGDEEHDLPFGEARERPTSWRDVETQLPDDIIAYTGKGRGAIFELARFMRHAADGGVGQSLADANRELGAIKRDDGTRMFNRWTIQRAWGALIDMNRLTLADGVTQDTGRSIWVKRDGE